MVDTSTMTEEVKAMYDSVRVCIKFSRWAYEAALEEGFTPNQAMQIASTYINSLTSAAANTTPKK